MNEEHVCEHAAGFFCDITRQVEGMGGFEKLARMSDYTKTPWPTIVDAAGEHVLDMEKLDVMVSLKNARGRVSAAISDGRIRSSGEGRSRRLNPDDIIAWREKWKQKELDRLDDPCGVDTPSDWIDYNAAADLYIRHVEPVQKTKATSRLRKARASKKFASNSESGRGRRIEPNSLMAWLLAEQTRLADMISL